jgi:type IV pilus assembly protein PilW|tara:strand:- start:931 stop:1923 length:993 start_codon:yes stop_codon:yes gene_type:complete
MMTIPQQRINQRREPLNSRASQGGFSLVELLIAVALGILLSWAILDVTLNSSRTAREVELTSEMVENGRYLSHLLKSEIRLAGFYGRLENYSNGTVAQPNPCSGLTAAELVNGMTFPLFGLDGVAAGDTTCNGDILLTGSDALLIRRADTNFVTSTVGLDSNQHYLQGTITAMVLDTGTNKTNFNLLEKDATTLAPIRQYHQTIYYVDDSNVFKRLRLVNGAYTPEPLIEGVDDFQLVYGIDRSGDGIPNAEGANAAFVELPASAIEWENVVSVKIFLVLSSTNPAPGLNDAKIYSYADKAGITFSDSKKRRLFSSVARLTNVSIKRAGL